MKKLSTHIPADFPSVDELYSIYGKRVRSNYPMPLPQAGDGLVDLTIRYDGIVPKTEDRSPNTMYRTWQKEGKSWHLRIYNQYGHTNEFSFSGDGTDIRATQSWPEWRDTLFNLMNVVMASAASIQGDNILHASSLVRHDKALLITGISGAGKSSLSAAFAANGFSVHSDDIALIQNDNDGNPVVMPGYPRIKVKPGITKYVENLNGANLIPLTVDSDALRAVEKLNGLNQGIEDAEKWLTAGELPGGFYDSPAPVHAILILDERREDISVPVVTEMKNAQAVMGLVEHIYGREWLNLPGQKSLEFCIQLASRLPVYRVNLPDNLHLLPASADLLYREIMG
ncbi:hypothetical protein DYD21_10400 [Rhodohalobacter sp. SW132]|uniref:hypothetical protein n=1 Tax=Rhodohalobacter sp. SW132 TaxID=2293433 RepID=UPI000E269EAF|nr:hypothetical protein [Rhodohalobacter sp. SW132]REL33807.1 hypothetical protein DYD21_10400 [Rhodohalobacter sp. SW132]